MGRSAAPPTNSAPASSPEAGRSQPAMNPAASSGADSGSGSGSVSASGTTSTVEQPHVGRHDRRARPARRRRLTNLRRAEVDRCLDPGQDAGDPLDDRPVGAECAPVRQLRGRRLEHRVGLGAVAQRRHQVKRVKTRIAQHGPDQQIAGALR